MRILNSQIVDKTIMEADQDRDGKISFEEFTKMVENTDVSMSMTLGKSSPSPTPSFALACDSMDIGLALLPRRILGGTITYLGQALPLNRQADLDVQSKSDGYDTQQRSLSVHSVSHRYGCAMKRRACHYPEPSSAF